MRVTIALVVSLLGSPLFGQADVDPIVSAEESESSESIERTIQIYLPRSIRVAVRSNDVRLDWYAPQVDEGLQYTVFRHYLPIDTQTIRTATQIAVTNARAGENRYYDTINEVGYWYYAVLPTRNGRPFVNFFLRRQNATDEGVHISERTLAQSKESLVRDIAVGATDNVAGLTFVPDNPFRDLYVLRSSTPITDTDAARKAERVARLPGESTTYADFPPPDVDLYYAVVDAHALESSVAGVQIELGENATRFPVRVADTKTYRDQGPFDDSRPRAPDGIILPLINSALIDREIFEDVEVLDPGRRARAPTSPIELLYPDTLKPTTSHERELQRTLQGSLRDADWQASLKSLQQLLRKNPDQNIAARIRHYQGQALYYSGKYQQALYEFIQARQFYDRESSRWIDRTLSRLSD